jgi:hypothetical protein
MFGKKKSMLKSWLAACQRQKQCADTQRSLPVASCVRHLVSFRQQLQW